MHCERRRQEDWEFKASLGYIASSRPGVGGLFPKVLLLTPTNWQLLVVTSTCPLGIAQSDVRAAPGHSKLHFTDEGTHVNCGPLGAPESFSAIAPISLAFFCAALTPCPAPPQKPEVAQAEERRASSPWHAAPDLPVAASTGAVLVTSVSRFLPVRQHPEGGAE